MDCKSFIASTLNEINKFYEGLSISTYEDELKSSQPRQIQWIIIYCSTSNKIIIFQGFDELKKSFSGNKSSKFTILGGVWKGLNFFLNQKTWFEDEHSMNATNRGIAK